MLDHILVDMDNTLVDWTKRMEDGLKSWLGIGLTVKFIDRWLPKSMGKFLFAEVYNRNLNFWNRMDTIPNLTPTIMMCLKESQQLPNPPRIWICTHLSGIDNSSIERMGKRRCAQRLFRQHNVELAGIIFVPRSEEKVTHFPAGKCMLIDDYEGNIVSTKAQGHDVLHVKRFYGERSSEYLITSKIATALVLNKK